MIYLWIYYALFRKWNNYESIWSINFTSYARR